MTRKRLPKFERGHCIDGTTAGHKWEPLSFVFETQLLDPEGRVRVRQPAIDEGRVYCVCMRCHQHTYIVTKWANFFLSDPWMDEWEAREPEDEDWDADRRSGKPSPEGRSDD